MKLDLRLKAILSFIEPSDKVGDIGSDHGFFSLACLELGCPLVQAIDNKDGPLSSTKKTLESYLSSSRVLVTKSDGLEKLDQAIETVVISGMGGRLITEILSNKKSRSLTKLILQPNNALYELRVFLNSNAFSIVDENIIYEDGKYYEIIICKPVEIIDALKKEDYIFGPILRKKKSSFFNDYWTNQLGFYQNLLLENLGSSRLEEVTEMIKLISKELSK